MRSFEDVLVYSYRLYLIYHRLFTAPGSLLWRSCDLWGQANDQLSTWDDLGLGVTHASHTYQKLPTAGTGTTLFVFGTGPASVNLELSVPS